MCSQENMQLECKEESPCEFDFEPSRSKYSPLPSPSLKTAFITKGKSFNFCTNMTDTEDRMRASIEYDKQQQELLNNFHPSLKTSFITKSKSFNFSNNMSETDERIRSSIEFEKQQQELLNNLHIAGNPSSTTMHMPVRISSKVSPSNGPKAPFHSISELIRKDDNVPVHPNTMPHSFPSEHQMTFLAPHNININLLLGGGGNGAHSIMPHHDNVATKAVNCPNSHLLIPALNELQQLAGLDMKLASCNNEKQTNILGGGNTSLHGLLGGSNVINGQHGIGGGNNTSQYRIGNTSQHGLPGGGNTIQHGLLAGGNTSHHGYIGGSNNSQPSILGRSVILKTYKNDIDAPNDGSFMKMSGTSSSSTSPRHLPFSRKQELSARTSIGDGYVKSEPTTPSPSSPTKKSILKKQSNGSMER